MEREPRIVLLGDSVLMDSVADCLTQRQMPGVLRTACTGIGDEFESLKPDLILFELGQPCSAQVVLLFERRQDMVMVGLDLDSSRVLVLGSHQRLIGNMEELHQVVQDEIMKLGDWSWGGEGDWMNCNNHSESRI